MIQIDILSVVPDLMSSFFEHSIMKRAIDKQILQLRLYNLRDFSTNKQKHVDDYAYGGAAGMVMMIEPIYNAITSLQKENEYDDIIYFAPEGKMFNQQMANAYSLKKKILLLCGHYKGIDQRIRDHLITQEISLGEFVLSGGEIPAVAFVDSVVRLIPGVLNQETSALSDSFQDGLIAPPIYTRPASFNGWHVPEILLQGNHQQIQTWHDQQTEQKTTLFYQQKQNKNEQQNG